MNSNVISAFVASASGTIPGFVLLLTAATGVIFCLVLIRDMASIHHRIECLITGTTDRKFRGSGAFSIPAAQRAHACLHVLERRLRNSHTGAGCNIPPTHPGDILPEFETELPQGQDAASFIFRRTADYCARRAQGTLAAVIPSTATPAEIMISNRHGRKEVLDLLSSFCGAQNWFRDASTPTLQAFSTVLTSGIPGLNYILTLPFLNTLGDGSPGLIMIGFRNPPEPDRIRLMEETARSLSRELPRLRSMFENSLLLMDNALASGSRPAFLAHISHDIKSPLNNLNAILSLMRLETQGSGNTELLEAGLSNCRAAAEIVDSLLDLSAYEAGHLRARPERIEINPLIEEIVGSFNVAAGLKGLSLEYCVTATRSIFADRRHTRRIISNLVSNAIKYTRFGRIEITASDRGLQHVVITVLDTGIGIEPSQIAKLFKPFIRINSDEGEGLGVGLALSRILTDLNKGHISVESSPGKGSQFSLLFPAYMESPLEKKGSNKPAEGTPRTENNHQSITVLFVDDDPDQLASTARAIRDPFVSVANASSIDEALSIINFERPDVIITDDSMPGGGGVKLCRKLAKRGMHTPVAVLTGNTLDVQRRYEGFPLAEIFEKPLRIEDIENWLRSEKWRIPSETA